MFLSSLWVVSRSDSAFSEMTKHLFFLQSRFKIEVLNYFRVDILVYLNLPVKFGSWLCGNFSYHESKCVSLLAAMRGYQQCSVDELRDEEVGIMSSLCSPGAKDGSAGRKQNKFVFVGRHQRRDTTGIRDREKRERMRFRFSTHTHTRLLKSHRVSDSCGRVLNAGWRHFTVWWALISSHHLQRANASHITDISHTQPELLLGEKRC